MNSYDVLIKIHKDANFKKTILISKTDASTWFDHISLFFKKILLAFFCDFTHKYRSPTSQKNECTNPVYTEFIYEDPIGDTIREIWKKDGFLTIIPSSIIRELEIRSEK